MQVIEVMEITEIMELMPFELCWLHWRVKITAAGIYKYLKIFCNQICNQNNLIFSLFGLKWKKGTTQIKENEWVG